MGSKIAWMKMLTVVLVTLTAALAAAQSSSEPPSCASKLTACLDYMNATTTPPSSCCDPLREAVTNERTCLCSIYNNTDLIQAFRINITQALNLPKICHINTGNSPDICKGGATSPPSSSTPSGGGTSGSGASAKITGAALAGLVYTLLVFGTYAIFY
ncbi:hypothetical protein BVRB_5g098200 [Beta vulgaris subsp. vulgaris]|nr:hypothetical protein BVRB_5g098200 [Beta vulgaris subsp. vulgaris]